MDQTSVHSTPGLTAWRSQRPKPKPPQRGSDRRWSTCSRRPRWSWTSVVSPQTSCPRPCRRLCAEVRPLCVSGRTFGGRMLRSIGPSPRWTRCGRCGGRWPSSAQVWLIRCPRAQAQYVLEDNSSRIRPADSIWRSSRRSRTLPSGRCCTRCPASLSGVGSTSCGVVTRSRRSLTSRRAWSRWDPVKTQS